MAKNTLLNKAENFETFYKLLQQLGSSPIRFPEGILQVAWSTVFCFKWLVQKHYVAKV